MKKAILRYVCTLCMLALIVSILPVSAFAASKSIEYYVTVDQTNQITTVYRISDNKVVRQMLCTTGKNGATPNGTYSMPHGQNDMDRKDWYHFKGFRCYAKYPTRIFKGVLFHSITYNKKTETSMARSAIEEYGHAASHGCVRLLVEDAKWIQEHCPIGTKVIIYESGIKDQNLWNLLFQEHYTEDSGMTYEEFLGGSISRYSSSDEVYRLQYRLHELGYFTGNVDGKWGEDTTNALLYAQTMTGSRISGNVDSAFMTLIESDDAPAVPGYDFSECMHEPGIRLVQTSLAALGLYTGDIDGVFDFEVSEAVAKFQSCYGYDQTGTPSVLEQEAMVYEAEQVVERCGEDVQCDLVSDAVQTATVTFDKSIRLRSKPDTDSHEVATIKPGTRLILIERGESWSKLKYGNSEGYMKNKYLSFGSYTVAYLECTGSEGTYRIGCSIEDLQGGAQQPCDSFKSYYSELQSRRKSALARAKEEANANDQSYSSLTSSTMKVNTGSDTVTLNLRAEPDKNADILQALPNGTVVEALNRNGGWTRVSVNGTVGYVVDDYLTVVTRDTSAFLAYSPKDATVVTEEGFAYVYADADKRSEKIGYVLTGSTVGAYATDNGFTYIRYTDNNATCYGFVKNETLTSEHFEFAEATEDDDDDTDVLIYAYVIDSVSSAPVYETASDSAKVLGSLPSGTKVTVIEADEDSDWVLIEYNGARGYVSNEQLRIDAEML